MIAPPVRLDFLATLIGARLLGDENITVDGIGDVRSAGEGKLSFVGHARDRQHLLAGRCRASAVIVDETFAAHHAHEIDCALLCGPDPAALLRLAVERLTVQPAMVAGIHPTAVVGNASIDPTATIGPGCVIGSGVVVGARTWIGARTVVAAGVHIGSRCRLGPGCVIGDEGFVFAPHGINNDRVASAASVVIDDDVDIGANVCIDRGLLRDTRIGAGCRIDNLVQVAHDVTIGPNCVLAAQVGIAGFATLGAGVVVAGQAGINPHVWIADGVRVGGQAGVNNDIQEPGAAVTGMPAWPHMTWLKAMARLRGLDALEARLRRLEQQQRDVRAPS
jgi:UDP-3-O-[3-hydroxymyristoyl] glucosamine N-acyltransferase